MEHDHSKDPPANDSHFCLSTLGKPSSLIRLVADSQHLLRIFLSGNGFLSHLFSLERTAGVQVKGYGMRLPLNFAPWTLIVMLIPSTFRNIVLLSFLKRLMVIDLR